MDGKELFDLVRESYAIANADYISDQIRIASAHMAESVTKIGTDVVEEVRPGGE